MKGSKKICLFQSFKTSFAVFIVAVMSFCCFCCCCCCCYCGYWILLLLLLLLFASASLLPPCPPPPPPPIGPWHMIGYRQTAMGTWKKVGQTCDWRSCHLVKEHGWSESADWVYMNEFSLPSRTVTGYRRRTVYQWTTDTYLLCCRGWQRRGDSCPIG